MIAIDTMLWIYNVDVKAREHRNVTSWLEGKRGKGVIETEDVLVNTVIAMEMVHNLRRVAKLPAEYVYDYVLGILTLRNLVLDPLNLDALNESISTFEDYFHYGIGGRDATVLASMRRHGVTTIATHDKNLLSVREIERIDPTHDPPLILRKGEKLRR
jgi:predicted nucleic acid-binding protein